MRGTIRFSEWWKVESTLLEQRKTYGCDKYPFYKNSPLPDSNLNSHLSNLSFLVESRIHYVNQKEWQQYDTPCLFIKRLFAESIPCNSKGIAPTRPSDVKALTRES